MSNNKTCASRMVLGTGLALLVAAGVTGCGNKESKPGQALVSVNGQEITVLQLNEEMQRANVQPAQQDAARKQLLEALVDRQLLQNEAAKDQTDRDPKVVQAVERAKSLIVAQAYMQKRVGTVTRPSKDEVADYYNKHPEFFGQRKVFTMRELVVATGDMDEALKKEMDSARTLDEVAAWLDAHQVKYARSELARSSSDLPSELDAKLLAMPKGQLFVIKEGERSMLITIADIKDAPVTLEVAQAQIEQFLFNKKNKDAADAELARLRAAAKITYLNQPATAPAAPAKPAAAAAATSAPSGAEAARAANERGVAGLK
ncbi:MAG: EpsD family peptidyl-prolyl cis-trans isomerase [Pseudomonadota bacterium]